MLEFIAATTFFVLILACLSYIALPRDEAPCHPIFADETPPHVPSEPDQRHHDERRNAYLDRLNQWIASLSDEERAEAEKKFEARLSAYAKVITTLRQKDKTP